MKEVIMRHFLLALFAASLLLVLTTPEAHALVNFTKYTFPTSTSQSAYLTGNFNLSGTNADSTQTGYNLSAVANYDLFYRSLPFSYNFNMLGNVVSARSIADGAKSQDAYDVRATTRGNKYFAEDRDWFGFGAATFEYRKQLGVDTTDDPYADVSAGVGYGRTIDATVLKQAWRMQEDWKKYGVIKSDLSDDQLIALARVIDRKSEFQSRYGSVEYRKYWYEAMEEVVRGAGVLSGPNLGAMGIIRIQEVLDEPTGRRITGWDARVGGGLVLHNFNGKKGDPFASAELDWSRPLSIDLQLNDNFYSRAVFADDMSYLVGDYFQVYYEITNRIDWDNSVRAEVNIPTVTGAKTDVSGNFTSSFLFYLENRLTFGPSFVVNYHDNGVDKALTNWSLLGSITYRLR
jgi:hypothetical protein